MLDKGAGVLPVAEAVAVVDGVAAQHGDKGEEEQAQHQQDLEDGQVELGDAKVAHGGDVEQGVGHNDGDDDGGDGDVVGPKGDHDVHGDNLKGHEKGHVEEEVPGHGEAERTVDPLAAEADKGGRHGNVGDHLGKALVDGPHDGAPDDKGDEEAGRTTLGQCGAHLHVQGWGRLDCIGVQRRWRQGNQKKT